MPERDTEIAVVGAGPAGLAAAVTAAEAGRRVLLIDDNPDPGGQIWRHRGEPPPRARAWIDRAHRAGVDRLSAATVVHAEDAGRLWVDHAGALSEVRTRRLVLACGAHERFLPFPGWTRPGVFGVGGLQALVKGGLEVEGRRVLLAGTGPLLLAVASDLRARGAQMVGIAEQAPRSRVLGIGVRALISRSKRRQTAALARDLATVSRWFEAWPTRVEATPAGLEVSLRTGSRTRRIGCDLFGCAFGLAPDTTLARLLGCAVEDGRVVVDDAQRTSVPEVLCAGESTGIGGVELALAEGELAGATAAGVDPSPAQRSRLERERAFASEVEAAFALRPELFALADDDTIVCRCEGVSMGRLRGFADARETKLQTRCGMGPCQGRICGTALQSCFDFAPGRPRPPLFPIPISHLGAHGRPPSAN